MFFQYGDCETTYLVSKDKRLGRAIQQIGHINREVDADLFSALVHHIIGQQISTAAQATIWSRLLNAAGTVTEDSLTALGRDPASTDWNDLQKGRLYSGFCEAGAERHFEFGAAMEFER